MFAEATTAFVDLSAQLGPHYLTEAGAAMGLGRDWDLGVGAYSGSIPATEGPTGSVGSCAEPMLSLSSRLVSSSTMSRASGSGRAGRAW